MLSLLRRVTKVLKKKTDWFPIKHPILTPKQKIDLKFLLSQIQPKIDIILFKSVLRNKKNKDFRGIMTDSKL